MSLKLYIGNYNYSSWSLRPWLVLKKAELPFETEVIDLDVDISNRITQIKVEEPPKRKGGIKVSNVAELVSKLKNEAKVI